VFFSWTPKSETGAEREEGLRGPGQLELDVPLLGGIHSLATLPFQQHGFDLVIQKLPCFGVPGIQPIVVDEEGLVFEPIAPTCLADLLVHAFSDGVTERGFFESGPVLLTTTAANGVHGNLGVGVKDRKG